MSGAVLHTLHDCVDAIRIDDAAGYSFCGVKRNLQAYGFPTSQTDHPIVELLAEDIYARFYARLQPSRHQGSRSTRVPFVGRLSSANRSRQGWEAGWSTRGAIDGKFVVERDGLAIYVQPSELFPDNQTAKADVLYQVNVGKELFNIIGGWYVVLGEHPDEYDSSEILTRIYLNIHSSEAVRLIDLCTTEWNLKGLPFRLKVPDDPAAFSRSDSAVLYLRKGYYQKHERLILGLLTAIRTREGVPAFTKPLGPGIAVAEDPGDGSSFGQSRCRLVARGLHRAFLGKANSTRDRIAFVVDEFRQPGFDFAHPYLAPNSHDIYGAAADGI